MTELAELRQIVDDLRVRVSALEEGVGGLVEPLMKIGFTLQQARYVAILMTRQVVRRESFVTLLYGLENDRPSEKLIDVILHHVRVKLRQHDIELRNLPHAGWYLRARDKATIAQLIAAKVRE